jgi:hypothetical protein
MLLPGIFWARQRLPLPDAQIGQLLHGITAGTITSFPIQLLSPATTFPLIS